MYKIDLITTSRADFSVWRPIYEAILSNSNLKPRFVVTGTHFLSSLGLTYQEVHREIPKRDRIDLAISDTNDSDVYLPEMYLAASKLLSSSLPDLICLLGDRFELLPILNAAILKCVPIAHFYGAEMDIDYCIDTQVRNAITKASHLHIVAHNDNKKRILSMGEEPWRVCVGGEQSWIATKNFDPSAILKEFFESKNATVNASSLVCATYHPPTFEPGSWKKELPVLIDALDEFPQFTYIWSGVNADPDGQNVKASLLKSIRSRSNHLFFDHLGGKVFHALMASSKFMVGNSSSGLRETAPHRLPVVNFGSRQFGRLHGSNVVDTVADKKKTVAAIRKALKMDRKKIINPFRNPKFPKNVADHLLKGLKNPNLRVKRLPQVDYELERVPE